MGQISPMMTHYLETKKQYPDCILFYRLGDFYEMFFEDAKTVSRELELTLAGKDCGLAAKEESDRIETENADTAPVQGTYDHQYQRDLVHHVRNLLFGLICGYIAQGRNIYARCRHWTA